MAEVVNELDGKKKKKKKKKKDGDANGEAIGTAQQVETACPRCTLFERH